MDFLSSPLRSKRILRSLVALLLLSLFSLPALAQSREYKLKAAFIYNFIKYIEWPESSGPIRIAVLGTDPFEGELEKLEERKVGGRAVEVSLINSVDEAVNYQAVFLSDPNLQQKLLNRVQGQPVLTISDTPGFSKMGGGITLVSARNRIRFQINTRSLEKAQLKANSKLLALASDLFS